MQFDPAKHVTRKRFEVSVAGNRRLQRRVACLAGDKQALKFRGDVMRMLAVIGWLLLIGTLIVHKVNS